MTEAILDRGEAVVAAMTPMGRIGQLGELAPTVLFLASDGASYITGLVMPIDEGKDGAVSCQCLHFRADLCG